MADSCWDDTGRDAVERDRQLAVKIAHDVRSPLTAICSFAECLAWLPAPDLTIRERYARAIVCEAQRLDRLLSDYLVVTGTCPAEPPQAVDPGALVREILGALREAAELRGLRLAPLRGAHYPALCWPEGRLRQIVRALLDFVVARSGEGQVLQVEIAAEFPERLAVAVQLEGGAGLRPTEVSLHQLACEALLAREGGWLRELAPPQAGLKLALPLVAASARDAAAPQTERIAS